MSEFTLTDFILAVLVLVGACIGGYWSYRGSQDAIRNQLLNERKNIAKALDIDLKTIYESPNFSFYYNSFKNDKTDDINVIFPKLRTEFDGLYNEKVGLYFVFNHDIAKFDHNLSSEIYKFYNNLLQAEECRDYISEYRYSEHVDIVTQINLRYNFMKNFIMECDDKIPEIRENLKEVYDSESLI